MSERTKTRSRHARGAVLGLAVGLLLATPRTARADNKNPTPEEISAARDLAKEGVRLQRAGKCDEALPKLERARDLYEAPVIPAVAYGDCLIQTGKVVQGTEVLQLVVRADLGSHAERFNLAAKETAKKLLAANLSRIGKLIVQVDAPAGVDVAVLLDKRPLPKSLVGIGRPTDPGEHVVEATAPGFLATSQTVTLTDGQETSVALTLVPDPAAAPPPVVAVPVAPPPVQRSLVPGVVFLGIGAAGLATGTVFGILALGTRSTLDRECPTHGCNPRYAGDLSSLKTQSWVSTIGFVAGGVSAGVGVVFLVRSQLDPPTTAGLRLTPTIGLGRVGLLGEF